MKPGRSLPLAVRHSLQKTGALRPRFCVRGGPGIPSGWDLLRFGGVAGFRRGLEGNPWRRGCAGRCGAVDRRWPMRAVRRFGVAVGVAIGLSQTAQPLNRLAAQEPFPSRPPARSGRREDGSGSRKPAPSQIIGRESERLRQAVLESAEKFHIFMSKLDCLLAHSAVVCGGCTAVCFRRSFQTLHGR